MRYDPATREIALKIAYYGPGMSGKSSNLRWLHGSTPSDRRSEITALDTNSERILQFEFLALELGQVQGANIRLQIATIPGQSYYSATRRKVLEDCDGVVFVVDSRREALDENIDAMNEFYGHLRQIGLPDDLPVVLQYNKQDLPTALTPDKLQPLLNHRGHTSFMCVATTGEGVAETCEAVVQKILQKVGDTELPRITETQSRARPQSWLMTCHRCQSMLDIPNAEVGKVYTCGVCRSAIELMDLERGLTQAPPPSKLTTGIHRRVAGNTASSPSQAAGVLPPIGSGGFKTTVASGSGGHAQAKAIPAPGRTATPDDGLSPVDHRPAAGTALRRIGDAPSGGSPVIPGGSLALEGYEVVQRLDTSPQGSRFRTREVPTGALYRAVDLSPTLLAQPGFAEALELMVRRMSVFSHPNVIGLRSVKRTAGRTVLLADDTTTHEPLSLILSRRRALAPPHAMGILRQVAVALQAAHAQGITHGWMRPDVILVDPEGNVLVDEFYLPAAPRFLTRDLAGDSAATEYYLPPEYLTEDLRGDPRCDMFPIGALLFKMLTGEGLVTGYNAHEALHKVLASGAKGLRDAQPGVSRDLDGFYRKLVATDRNERFADHNELLEQMDRFGGGAKRQQLQLTMNVQRGGGYYQDGGQMVGLAGSAGPGPSPGVPLGASPVRPSTTRLGVGTPAASLGSSGVGSATVLGGGPGLGVGPGLSTAHGPGATPAVGVRGNRKVTIAGQERGAVPPTKRQGGGGFLGLLVVLLVIAGVVGGALWWLQQGSDGVGAHGAGEPAKPAATSVAPSAAAAGTVTPAK